MDSDGLALRLQTDLYCLQKIVGIQGDPILEKSLFCDTSALLENLGITFEIKWKTLQQYDILHLVRRRTHVKHDENRSQFIVDIFVDLNTCMCTDAVHCLLVINNIAVSCCSIP